MSELSGRERGQSPTLVGFSYGGLVAGVTAAAAPERIGRLIYIDAFIPQPGVSMLESLPAAVADQMEQLARTAGDGWKLPPLPLTRLGGVGPVAAGIDPAAVEQILSRRGFHPIGTYREPAPIQPPFPADRTLFISCTAKTTRRSHAADRREHAGGRHPSGRDRRRTLRDVDHAGPTGRVAAGLALTATNSCLAVRRAPAESGPAP